MVSAHGTGTPLNDEVEANLIAKIFDGQQPFVMAIKSWIGHLAAACGAVELAICLSSFKTGVWPVIRNLQEPCSRHGTRFLHGFIRRWRQLSHE